MGINIGSISKAGHGAVSGLEKIGILGKTVGRHAPEGAMTREAYQKSQQSLLKRAFGLSGKGAKGLMKFMGTGLLFGGGKMLKGARGLGMLPFMMLGGIRNGMRAMISIAAIAILAKIAANPKTLTAINNVAKGFGSPTDQLQGPDNHLVPANTQRTYASAQKNVGTVVSNNQPQAGTDKELAAATNNQQAQQSDFSNELQA